MRLSKFLVYFLFILLLGGCFSVFLLSSGQVDSSVLSMGGVGWSVKVDSSLQSVLDSKSEPFVSVAKAGSEKELFLTLNSLKDCVAGQIQFKIETTGLTVYKQLPLDKELSVDSKEGYTFVNATVAMIKDKVVVSRPENVVNSFACFDDSGKKVLHIYASKLIDAKGNSVWVDSDLKDGLLTVYLDQKWLESAVFPVIVDPTFGFSSIGASRNALSTSYVIGTKFTVAEDGTAISIHGYTYGFGASRNVKYAIYSDNSGAVNSLLVETSGIAVTTDEGWNYGNVSYVFNAGTYWLSNIIDGDGRIAYDTGDSNQGYYDGGITYPVFTDPAGSVTYDTSKYSLYVTYTVEPEATPTPSPSPSPSSTPSGGSYVFVLGEADWVLVLEIVMLVSCFVSFVWLGKVPIVPLLVGLFAFLVSLYTGLSGLWVNVVIGYFGAFVALVGGLTMLLVGLGVRVKR